jgi:hypothetical protein
MPMSSARSIGIFAAAFFALWGSAAWAQAPSPGPLPGGGFHLPVDCRLNENCWIVNYFDAEKGPEARDFRCLSRTFDGHDGTDVAIRDRNEMSRGVAVLAGAPGIVTATRDGEPDGAYAKDGRRAVTGRECGNGVVIDYGSGWSGQFCHMRQGSVRVHTGDRVEAATQLGLVGMSGMAAFPHAIDPFTARPAGADCNPAAEARPLWNPAANVEYAPFSLYASGFAPRQPTPADIIANARGAEVLSAQSRNFGIWAAIFGVREGDTVTMRVADPTGATFLESQRVVARAQALHVPYLARARRDDRDWPVGRYRGSITLERLIDNRPVRQTREMSVEVR